MSNRRSERRAAWPTVLLRGALCLLMLAFFLLSVLAFVLRGVILDRDLYRGIVRDPSVPPRMVDYARVELEAECLFYGLPFEIIDEALTESVAAVYTESYVDAVYDAVFITGSMATVPVDPDLFRQPIATLLEPEGIDQETIDDLATEFAAVTEATWSIGLGEKLLTPLNRVCGHPLVSVLADSAYLFLGATVAMLAVSLLLAQGCLRRHLFAAVGTLTVGSMLWFVPVWLLKRYDLASRLVLGDTPLKILVDGALNTVNQRMLTLSAWLLAATAVVLVAVIVWMVWPVATEPTYEE